MSGQQAKKCPICGKELNTYYCTKCGWFDAPIIGTKMKDAEEARMKLSQDIYQDISKIYTASTPNNHANDVKTTLDDKKQLDELKRAKDEIKRLESELEQAKKATPKAEAAPNTSGSKLLKPVAFLKAEYDRHEQIFALYEGTNTFGCETIDNNVPDKHNEIALPGNFGLAKKQFKIKITATKVELSAYAGCNLSRTGTLSNGDSFSTTTNNKTITYKFTF